MHSLRQSAQKGYTLIELLLYISIVGALLGSLSLYFGVIVTARVKNQTISEVDQQGTLVMEHLAQTVRNADAITEPYPGASSSELGLAVPTPALSPSVFNLAGSTSTLLGLDTDGTADNSDSFNVINATKFVASASGTVSALYARVGSVLSASPNNKAQMAIYSGAANPTALLARSQDAILTGSAWNAFSIPAVSVTSGQTYWLAYNTNALVSTANNVRVRTGTANQNRYVPQAYGAWPASFTGTSENIAITAWASIDSPSATGAMRISEGGVAATPIPLTNSDVQISGITFTNVSRSGTPGAVRISFTISRVNPAGKNEYDYQKTFTTTATVRH